MAEIQLQRVHPSTLVSWVLKSLSIGFALWLANSLVGCVIDDRSSDSCNESCGPAAVCDDRGRCVCRAGYAGDPEDPEDACDPIQRWIVVDVCDDGLPVQWKLFATDWTWPGGDGVYETPGLNVDDTRAIRCLEGELICFGAQAGVVSWGVGLDQTRECTDCCYECRASTIDIGLLGCP